MKSKATCLALAWLLAVVLSLFWNVSDDKSARREIALQSARSVFHLIVDVRSWNTGHGGVYAPITAENQPNPYLDIPFRDLVSREGLELTMINPAYMTRQIAEIASRQSGVHFHLTSLKPMRPENKATLWEAEWLHSFENGKIERSQVVQTESGTEFRYMAPLSVEQGCLECHAAQGYKLGDIRGGISITLPYFSTKDIWPLYLSHLGAALIGLAGIIVFQRLIGQEQLKLLQSNAELEKENTDRRKAEQGLQDSLLEKEVLLREIHHRVKNNLQTVASLLNLQAGYTNNEAVQVMLQDCHGRISAMADIHEKLYMSNDLASISFDGYGESFVRELYSIYGTDPSRIHFTIEGSFLLNINQAIPCGLIIHELVSNSLKYAFPDGRAGSIFIMLRYREEDELEMSVGDDGVGLPENLNIDNSPSFGLNLVKILASNQLDGDVALDRTNGTCFRIRFTRKKEE